MILKPSFNRRQWRKKWASKHTANSIALSGLDATSSVAYLYWLNGRCYSTLVVRIIAWSAKHDSFLWHSYTYRMFHFHSNTLQSDLSEVRSWSNGLKMISALKIKMIVSTSAKTFEWQWSMVYVDAVIFKRKRRGSTTFIPILQLSWSIGNFIHDRSFSTRCSHWPDANRPLLQPVFRALPNLLKSHSKRFFKDFVFQAPKEKEEGEGDGEGGEGGDEEEKEETLRKRENEMEVKGKKAKRKGKGRERTERERESEWKRVSERERERERAWEIDRDTERERERERELKKIEQESEIENRLI